MNDLLPLTPAEAALTIAGVAVVLVLIAAVIVAMRARRRSVRWDVPAQSAQGPDRRNENRLTLVVAGVATAVSAQGMWSFFDDVLHTSPVLRVGMFAFLELAMLVSAIRARSNVLEFGRAGVDGIAVWVITCMSALFAALDADTWTLTVFRFAPPLVAAWLWERGMSIQRRRSGGRTIHWRITPERMLVRLGVAEAGDRTASEVDAHRRLTVLARTAKQVRTLRSAGASPRRLNRAINRLDTAMERAVEHAGLSSDPARQAALLGQLGALYHAVGLADLDTIAPWTTGTAPSNKVEQVAEETNEDQGTRETEPDGLTDPRPRKATALRARKALAAPVDGVDRDAVVAELTAEILAAMAAGDTWSADYTDLMSRTGRRRSWCEKVVSEARSTAARTAISPAPQAATDQNDQVGEQPAADNEVELALAGAVNGGEQS